MSRSLVALTLLVPLLAACPEEELKVDDAGLDPDGGDAMVIQPDADAPDAGVRPDGGDASVPWIAMGGPTGGRLTGLGADPRGTIYASSFHGARFRRGESEQQWIRSEEDPNSYGGYAFTFAFDPQSPDIVYAAGTGVFKSTDRGETWRQVALSGSRVLGLAIDPTDGDVIYAAEESGMYKSTNGGTRFVPINTGLPANGRTLSLVIDPSAPLTLYVGTNAGVFRTIDGGATWTAANTGLEEVEIVALAIDPLSPLTLYAGSLDNGGYKTIDGGTTWSPLLDLPYDVRSIAVDPVTPELVYAAIYHRRIRKSENRGESWVEIGSEALTGDTLRVIAAPGAVYAVSEEDGVYQSKDQGETWERSNAGLAATVPNILAIANGVLYAGTGNCIFDSEDGAATWSEPSRLYLFNDLAIAPDVLYAATGGGIYKSENGVDWTQLFQAGTVAQSIAIDPTSTSTIYAGFARDLMKSTNGGRDWEPASTGMAANHVSSIVVDPSSPRTIYAHTQDGVFKSIDGAKTWSSASAGLPSTTLRFKKLILDPDDPSTLYAAGSSGVYKSIDGALTWSQTGAELGTVTAIAISASNPAVLFAGGFEGQIFKTTNGGTSWALASDGIPPAGFVYGLAIDPLDPELAYAGVGDYGVYKTTTGGD
jgi:photosystem II stability/assembly factor-like uncharacterized protein